MWSSLLTGVLLEIYSPFKAFTGKKPNVENLRIFGCDAYAYTPKDERKKLDSKTKKSTFLM